MNNPAEAAPAAESLEQIAASLRTATLELERIRELLERISGAGSKEEPDELEAPVFVGLSASEWDV